MTFLELSLAIFALLVTPGPTNTLMFVAGAERGLRRALRLIPAELAAYLLVVVPLSLGGVQLMSAAPAARPVVAVLAGLWVAVLAVRLWHPAVPGTSAPASVTARRVFVTTLLNPKALIFGLVLIPAAPGLAAGLAGFAAQVAVVAALWAAGGAVAAGTSSPLRMLRVRQAAAVWLGMVAVLLVARGFGA